MPARKQKRLTTGNTNLSPRPPLRNASTPKSRQSPRMLRAKADHLDSVLQENCNVKKGQTYVDDERSHLHIVQNTRLKDDHVDKVVHETNNVAKGKTFISHDEIGRIDYQSYHLHKSDTHLKDDAVNRILHEENSATEGSPHNNQPTHLQAVRSPNEVDRISRRDEKVVVPVSHLHIVKDTHGKDDHMNELLIDGVKPVHHHKPKVEPLANAARKQREEALAKKMAEKFSGLKTAFLSTDQDKSGCINKAEFAEMARKSFALDLNDQ